MRYVFVTGASGFIGKYVIDALHASGFKLVVLVRNRKNYKVRHNEVVVEGDFSGLLSLAEIIRPYKPESCVHLAWEGIPDYSFEQSEKNLQYGIQILKFCKDMGIRQLVVSGSCWEYKNPKGCIDESWPCDDSNHFKVAKNTFRLIADAFCRENKICFNWLRLFYVYGPGQKKESLIPYIIEELAQGRTPLLSGISNQNDFIYVEDVANAIAETVKRKPRTIILNIGFGKASRVSDILNKIAENFKVEKWMKMSSDISAEVDFFADRSLSTSVLEWDPEVSIEEGICRVIKFYKAGNMGG